MATVYRRAVAALLKAVSNAMQFSLPISPGHCLLTNLFNGICSDHLDAARLSAMGLHMQRILREDGIRSLRKCLPDARIQMRVAVHVGKCVGGIVGNKNPRYHLFGKAVDVVMKMESCGTAAGVIMSTGQHDSKLSGNAVVRFGSSV